MTESTKPAVIEMTHPESTQKIEVDPANVDRYRSQGWSAATADAPAPSAGLSKWQEFARSKGFTDDEIAGKSKDELRAALA